MKAISIRRRSPAEGRGLYLTLAVLLCGCAAQPPAHGLPGDDPGDGMGTSPAGAPPSLAQLAHATFTGVYEEPIRLEDGRYEGPPFGKDSASRPTLKLVTELHAAGDLNGDGRPEAAVLLVERSGGTGTFLYIAAVGIWEGAPVNLGTRLVGDRVQVRAISVADATIRLDVVAHGDDDAMCCPTRLVRRVWSWSGGNLEERAPAEQGLLEIAALAGVTWRLDGGRIGAPRARGSAITARFDDGKIAGSGGCNEYSGAVEERGPGEIVISTMTTTRMACDSSIMEGESAFFAALLDTTRYGFDMGRLTLSGSADADPGSALVFTPVSLSSRAVAPF